MVDVQKQYGRRSEPPKNQPNTDQTLPKCHWNIRVSTQWEHSLTNLLGHDPTSDPGIALRQWVHFQGVENVLDLLSWEEDELKAIPAQQVFNLDDHGQGSYLRTNQTKQICGLITYMKHIFRDFNSGMEVRTDPFHPFLPEEWNQHT